MNELIEIENHLKFNFEQLQDLVIQFDKPQFRELIQYTLKEPIQFKHYTKRSIFISKPMLDQFKEEIYFYYQLMFNNPSIKEVIIYTVYETERYISSYDRHHKFRQLDQIILYLNDQVDLLYTVNFYKGDIQLDDEINKHLNKISKRLTKLGINNSINNGYLYIPNIDKDLYSVVDYENFNRNFGTVVLPVYDKLINGRDESETIELIGERFVHVDISSLIETHPDVGYKYLLQEVIEYATLLPKITESVNADPELYEIGEIFLKEYANSKYYSTVEGKKELEYVHERMADMLLTGNQELTDDKKRKILNHLIAAGERGKRMRTQLFFSWTGLPFRNQSFEINPDADTLFELMKLIRQLKKD